jgi:hypothetical protein
LAVGEEAAQPLWDGDHPLPHGHRGNDVIDEMCGCLRYPAAVVRWTDAAPLARESASLVAAGTRRASVWADFGPRRRRGEGGDHGRTGAWTREVCVRALVRRQGRCERPSPEPPCSTSASTRSTSRLRSLDGQPRLRSADTWARTACLAYAVGGGGHRRGRMAASLFGEGEERLARPPPRY